MTAYVASDLHLGHAGILTFVTPDGAPLRPFMNLADMHHELMKRWNKKVNPQDRVYVLGDVAFSKPALQLMSEFNGKKVLIAGNHDRLRLSDYAAVFEDVRGAYFRDGLIFTHVPVHPAGLTGHYQGNVHGHLHAHLVYTSDGEVDKRYFNACLERNNFAPVSLDCIKDFFRGDGRAEADV